MEYLACLVLGVIVGVVTGVLYVKKTTKEPEIKGTLMINTSDPDGPYLFLQLSDNVDSVLKERYVTFSVNIKK